MLVVKKQEAPTEEVEISKEGSTLFCVHVFQLSNYFVVVRLYVLPPNSIILTVLQ
jgi:hypothetical protein